MSISISSMHASTHAAYRNAVKAQTEAKASFPQLLTAGESSRIEPTPGRKLSRVEQMANGELILPSWENIAILSEDIAGQITAMLEEKGIAQSPPFDLDFDWRTGLVEVKGDRADTAAIADAVNGYPDLVREIQTLTAISSHAVAIQKSIEFQEAYAASDSPEEVVARYRYLFGKQQAHTYSLHFEDGLINVLEDGKPIPIPTK